MINLKELMNISLYGLEIANKFKMYNIKISIKLYLRKLQNPQHGLISKLKVMLILLDYYLCLKEPILTNLTNSMKKNRKLNFL